MCGRFTLAIDADGLLRAYVASPADHADEWEPLFSIAPATPAPVLHERLTDEGELVRTLGPATWGFRPAWAKAKGPRPINARLETVATNGMFRSAFASSRVVVPMTGYYEWAEDAAGKKQPFYIHGTGTALLHAAGLLAGARDEDGAWSVTFTIITRTARDASGQVHERMPVFLTDDAVSPWLAPGKLAADEKEHLLGVLDDASSEVAGQLETYPVDRRVNSTRSVDPHDPGLIEPITL